MIFGIYRETLTSQCENDPQAAAPAQARAAGAAHPARRQQLHCGTFTRFSRIQPTHGITIKMQSLRLWIWVEYMYIGNLCIT